MNKKCYKFCQGKRKETTEVHVVGRAYVNNIRTLSIIFCQTTSQYIAISSLGLATVCCASCVCHCIHCHFLYIVLFASAMHQSIKKCLVSLHKIVPTLHAVVWHYALNLDMQHICSIVLVHLLILLMTSHIIQGNKKSGIATQK